MTALREKYIPMEMYQYLVSEFPDRGEDTFAVEMDEFVKFLVLFSYYPKVEGSFIPVTKEIDEIWHTYILETRAYQKLCISLPGQRDFIHHQSISYSDYKKIMNEEQLLEEHEWWLGAYFSTFGPFDQKNHQYWSIVNFLIHHHGWSLEEVNFFSSSIEWADQGERLAY